MSTNHETKIWIGAVKDFPIGARRVVDIDLYEEILVLNLRGTIYAVSNICPHAGAALERGPVEGTILYCPLHRWGFDVLSGICTTHSAFCARIYTVNIDAEQLFLSIP